MPYLAMITKNPSKITTSGFRCGWLPKFNYVCCSRIHLWQNFVKIRSL